MKVNSFIESFSIVKIDEMNHNFSMMTDIENRAQKTEIFGSKKNNENPITDRDAISYKKCIFNLNLNRRKCGIKGRSSHFDLPKH
jgi:hypothetical protein